MRVLPINVLIALIIKRCDHALQAAALDIRMEQRVQPQQQGAAPKSGAYIKQGRSRRVGFPSVATADPDELSGLSIQTEYQLVESNFNISALSKHKATVDSKTSKDIAFILSNALQSRKFIYDLASEGAAILRVTDIRSPEFETDFQQLAFHPNFDITIQHTISTADLVETVHRAEWVGAFRV